MSRAAFYPSGVVIQPRIYHPMACVDAGDNLFVLAQMQDSVGMVNHPFIRWRGIHGKGQVGTWIHGGFSLPGVQVYEEIGQLGCGRHTRPITE